MYSDFVLTFHSTVSVHAKGTSDIHFFRYSCFVPIFLDLLSAFDTGDKIPLLKVFSSLKPGRVDMWVGSGSGRGGFLKEMSPELRLEG